MPHQRFQRFDYLWYFTSLALVFLPVAFFTADIFNHDNFTHDIFTSGIFTYILYMPLKFRLLVLYSQWNEWLFHVAKA